MTIDHVAAPTSPRYVAALTLSAGALFVIVPLLVELVTGDAFLLMALAVLLMVAAMPGLRRLQAGRDGAAGRWGVRLTVAGLGLVAVLVASAGPLDAWLGTSARAWVESAWMLLAGLGMLSALVGVVAFSVGVTRAGVLPAAGIWVFLGGLVVALVTETYEQSLSGAVPVWADVAPPAGFMVAGVGLLVLGRAAQRLRA